MSKVVLITGASGFVGRHLAKFVQTQGDHPIGYSLRYQQDVRNYDQLRSFIAMSQPDEIHHLAAQAYVPETATDIKRGYEVNVTGTVNLLEAVRQTGSRARIHIAGTSEEYGYEHSGTVIDERTLPHPQSPYGASKLAAGSIGLVYAARYGMDVVVTRAFNHTGPGQAAQYAIASFTRQVALVKIGRAKQIRVGNLDAVRDYTDVRDICNAYRKAITLESGIYNICSGHVLTMAEILTKAVEAGDVLGSEIVTDPRLYRPMTTKGNTTMPTPDCTKFREATDWLPTFELEDTLAEMVNYWQEQL